MKGNRKTKGLCILCIAVFLMISKLSTVTAGAAAPEEKEYQETEKAETTEKTKQELSLLAEEKRVRYGESFSVVELLESNVDLQEVELLLEETDRKSILEIENGNVRAVGVNGKEGGKTTLAIQILETDTSEASPVVKLPVIVDKVSPKWEVCVENIQIPLYGKLEAEVKPEKEETYADLMEKDEKLKLYCEVFADEKKVYTLRENDFLKNGKSKIEIPVLPQYFQPFQKDKKFTLRTYLGYEGENSPYELTEKAEEIMLTACEAEAEIEVTKNGIFDYRADFFTGPVLKAEIKKTGISGENELTEEEKAELIYTVISSDLQVAEPEKETFAATEELKICLKGVGKTTLTLRVTGGDIYQIKEVEIPIEVCNSALQENDVTVICRNAQGAVVTPLEHWINGECMMMLSEEGKKYYSHLGYVMGEEEKETEILHLEKEMPLQEISFFALHARRNASTKEMDEGVQKILLGIDKTSPEVTQFTYSQNAFEPTKTATKAYYADSFVIQGSFCDKLSGISKIQMTYDGTQPEHAEWTDLKTTWEKGAKEAAFCVELGNGKYPALAIRAIDMAGNVSEAVKVSEDGKRYQEIIVDKTEPLLDIKAFTGKKKYDGRWTNQPVICTVREKKSEEMQAGIYQIKYQYVKAGESCQENADWKILDTDTIQSGGMEKEDFCNQNGTYYFKAVSKSGVETGEKQQSDTKVRVRLQQLLPEKEEIIESGAVKERKNEWYNKASGVPRLTFQYPVYDDGKETKEYGAPISVCTILERKDEKGVQEKVTAKAEMGIYEDDGQLKQDDIEKLTVTFGHETGNYAIDGIYTLEYWICDEAGNESVHEKRVYKIDTHEPTALSVMLDGTEMTAGNERETVYAYFFQNAVFAEAKAEFGISGMDALRVMKAKNIGDWNGQREFEKTDGKITLTPDTRCFLYVQAEDMAGNTSEIWTRGVVVDKSMPSGKQGARLLSRPSGENKNHFYNSDVTVEIELQDMPQAENFSGLELVTYKVAAADKEENTGTEEILFQFSKKLPTEDEIIAAQNFSVSRQLEALKNESNEVIIEVTATDRCGNSITDRENLKIDVTKPEIQISFLNEGEAKNGHYHNHKRTAQICVKELNFDSSLIELYATKDGEEYPITATEWLTEGNIHKTTVSFEQDGDYILWAKGKDMADNESDRVETELFTIDMTPPVLQITYDNEAEGLPGYYQNERQATIEITEHNFSKEQTELVSQQSVFLSEWTHKGDVHTAKITFSEDGMYTYEIKGMDLAGNSIIQEKTEEFVLDMTLPEIWILGVEDGSANKGEIAPQVVVRDENLYPEGVQISVKTGSGKEIEFAHKRTENQKEYTCHMPELSQKEDDIYYLTVSAADKAGNRQMLTYRYSLNRYGSTYDISAIERLVEQKYHRFSQMEDIEIVEMNVDCIEEYEIYLSRNGRMLTAKEGKRPSGGSEEVWYEVEKTGNEQTGYTNVYRIYRENFDTEGLYNLTFYSKDRAGNEVNSTLAEKHAKARFIIDNTMPQVVIEGVQSNQIYRAEKKEVNLLVRDNFKLKEAVFYLRNEKGEILESWDYMKLAKEGEIVTVALPGSDEKLFLTYQVTDMAGNEMVVLPETEEVPKGFFVTTNRWLSCLYSETVWKLCGMAGFLLLTGGLLIKRKRE